MNEFTATATIDNRSPLMQHHLAIALALITLSSFADFVKAQGAPYPFPSTGLEHPEPFEPDPAIYERLLKMLEATEAAAKEFRLESQNASILSWPISVSHTDYEWIQSLEPVLARQHILALRASEHLRNEIAAKTALLDYLDQRISTSYTSVARASAELLYSKDRLLHWQAASALLKYLPAPNYTFWGSDMRHMWFHGLPDLLDSPSGDRVSLWMFTTDAIGAFETLNDHFNRNHSALDLEEWSRLQLIATEIRYSLERAIYSDKPQWTEFGQEAIRSLLESEVWWHRALLAGLYYEMSIMGPVELSKSADSLTDDPSIRVSAIRKYKAAFEYQMLTWNWCGTK